MAATDFEVEWEAERRRERALPATIPWAQPPVFVLPPPPAAAVDPASAVGSEVSFESTLGASRQQPLIDAVPNLLDPHARFVTPPRRPCPPTPRRDFCPAVPETVTSAALPALPLPERVALADAELGALEEAALSAPAPFDPAGERHFFVRSVEPLPGGGFRLVKADDFPVWRRGPQPPERRTAARFAPGVTGQWAFAPQIDQRWHLLPPFVTDARPIRCGVRADLAARFAAVSGRV